jgi:tetratricopeptide (TPR) repeat protein
MKHYIRTRSPSEVIKRGYSDEEMQNLFELSRFFLELGYFKRAETILRSLVILAPDFTPVWLGLGYLDIMSKSYETAQQHARKALIIDPLSSEAMLMIVVASLCSDDITSAGSFLGELKEQIASGIITDKKLVRLFESQLARYESRISGNLIGQNKK